MTNTKPADFGETPTVEVRVFHHGELIETRLFETVEEATALVASREEVPGVECEVDDLSALTHDNTSFEVGASDLDGGYPHDVDTAEP